MMIHMQFPFFAHAEPPPETTKAMEDTSNWIKSPGIPNGNAATTDVESHDIELRVSQSDAGIDVT